MESSSLLPWIAPGVLIGFPVGHWLITRVGVETFRRVCMSFDAYLVAFGLSRTLVEAGVQPLVAYQALALTSILDTIFAVGLLPRERRARHGHDRGGDMIDVVAAARELADAKPADILAWAASALPRLTFATGFGAEGCVLIDLVARARLPIDLFTLDTGVLFPETIELWHRLEAHYGVEIRAVTPARSLEQQAAAHGAELWSARPIAAASCARSSRCARRSRAGMAGSPRSPRAERRACDRRGGRARRQVRPREGQSARRVDARRRVGLRPRARRADQPAARARLSVDRLRPVHVGGDPGEALRAGRWRQHAAKTECGLHEPRKASA